MIFFSTLLISMFISMALIPILRGLAVKLNAMDFPNPRKVHIHPVPKIGGIAMALGTLLPIALLANGNRFINAVLIGAWIVVIFGIIDDFKEIGYKGKFLGQFAAALIVIFYGDLKICNLGACLPEGTLLPDILAIPLTILAIVGVTNAINFSDGLDGLAGGTTLLILLCIGYLAHIGGYLPQNHFIALFCAAAIGAVFGFLRFNTYPATIFMGDSGSQLLGFLTITLALKLTQANTPLSPLLPLLLLGFPVLDTLTVMAERISDGKSPFQADKNHFHHKLMRLGLFHTEAVVTIYLVTAILVVSSFVFRFYSEWFILIFYLVFAGLIVTGFVAADRSGWTLKRSDLVDKIIKGKLRLLKEKNILIQVSFHIVEYVLPLLLMIACLVPSDLPLYVSGISAAFIGVILGIWILKKQWLTLALRLCFYLIVPVMFYLGKTSPADWAGVHFGVLYNLSFGVLAFFVVLTLKFTGRQKGFRATPTDFLILFIALVVPNLPDPRIQSLDMGLMATKTIVLIFSFEVLVGELRGKLTKLVVMTIAALVLVAAKSLI